MKKTAMIITLIFTTITIAGTALAWGPCGSKGNGFNRGNGYSKGFAGNCQGFGNPDLAGLTQEQQDQLAKLRQDFIDQTAPLRIDLVAKHKEMQILWQTTAPGKDELLALNRQISDLKSQMAEKRIDFMLKAKEIAPDVDLGPGPGFGQKCGKRGSFNRGPRSGCPYSTDQAPAEETL